MDIRQVGGDFRAKTVYGKHLPLKEAGFRWDPQAKEWYTDDVRKLAAVITLAENVDISPESRKAVEPFLNSLAESRATTADIEVPAPEGLNYLPFQKAGIAFVEKRNNVLLADSMGLGKTIQAIGVMNLHSEFKRVLIVCPNSLKLNWRNELKKWLTVKHTIWVAGSSEKSFPYKIMDGILIINYDALKKYKERLSTAKFDLIVADESHALKSTTALRTKAMHEIIRNIPRRIFLTGTPVMNRPEELWTTLNMLDPQTWNNAMYFYKRYCGAVVTKYGLDKSGATNLEELQSKLRTTCLPYNIKISTEIGDLPIGFIVENKLNIRVYTINEKGQTELRPIVGFSKRNHFGKMVTIRAGEDETTSTPDHLFWTKEGYSRADSLTDKDNLLVLSKNICNEAQQDESSHKEILFSAMCRKRNRRKFRISQQRGFNKKKQKSGNSLSLVSQGANLSKEMQSEVLQQQLSFFGQVSQRRGKGKIIIVGGNQETIFSEKREVSSRTAETKNQANFGKDLEFSNFERKGCQMQQGILGIESFDKKEQKVFLYATTDCQTLQGIKMAGKLDRIFSSNNSCDRAIPKGEIILCQSRFSESGKENCCRSGWKNSSEPQTDNSGQEERCCVRTVRVEGIKIHDKGDRQRFGFRNQNDYAVYDIEVSGNHNFFANNILVHNCMIRRLKEDVLKELPPKFRQVVELPAEDFKGVLAREAEAAEMWTEVEAIYEGIKPTAKEGEYENVVANMDSNKKWAFEELARIRHETAVAKAPSVVTHVTEMLDGNGKVVVFAHHHDVIDYIFNQLQKFGYNPVKLDGRDKLEEREQAVSTFQNDPKCRVFIGGMKAAGVGITLTAAHVVVFAELDWVPAVLSQAEDRLHRIGQLDNVLVQHVVIEGSIDAKLAKVVLKKMAIIRRATDEKPKTEAPVINVQVKPSFESKNTVEDEETQLVHLMVKMLAGVCDGAVSIDGRGFSKLDSVFGKSLANCKGLSAKQAAAAKKMVQKYVRQLPADVYNKVFKK